jgi:branched-chain amino acid transport system substrate-binding protein
MVAGLSGRMSQLGVSARNAVQLAVIQANEAGGINGRQIELIIRDNQGDPVLNGQAIRELADLGVAGIIGPLMSKMATSVLETIEIKPVVVISPTISTDAVKNIDDYFLRLMPAASQEARTMASVVFRDGHLRSGVVYDASNRAYTEPIFALFKQTYESNGGRVAYVNDMSDADEKLFGSMADEILAADIQALYMICSGIDAASLAQQIRKRTSEIQFYGAYWVKTGKLIQQGGRSVEGLVIAAPFEQKIKSQAYTQFSTRHQEMFQAAPGFVAAYAYDATQVLLTGLRRSPELTPDDIKNTILELKTFQGLEDAFDINEYGDVIRSMMLLTIDQGEFKRRPNSK